MTALYVLAGIMLFIIALLILKVRLIFAFDGNMQIKVGALFVNIDLLKLVQRQREHPKKKPAKQAGARPAEQAKKRKGSIEDFESFVDLIISTVEICTRHFSQSLKVKLKKLRVSVGCQSAEQTALMYGRVCVAAGTLMEFLTSTSDGFKVYYENIDIYPDYLSQKFDFAVEAVLSVRVWQILKILFSVLGNFNAVTRKRISERNGAKA